VHRQINIHGLVHWVKQNEYP